MKPVFIAKANLVSSLGSDVESLYKGLIAGKKGFSRMNRFDTGAYVSSHAGLIPNILPQTGEDSAILTMARQLIKQMGPVDKTGLLITASTKGGIDLMPPGRDLSSPKKDIPKGLKVSDLPGVLSQELGLDRPGFNINAACASSTIAIAKGAELIRQGREHTVVIIAMDLITEFVFSGFSAIGAMSPLPAMPFDQNRQGLTLGEGGAFVVLMDKERLSKTKTAALAELKGWGIAGDASHLTAPARDGYGLKLAITQACASGNISMESLKVICAHGTGTQYNDAMEIKVIQDLFSPDTVMAHSIKGAIGHTLGAAGAIETALCTTLLDKRILPGTIGLKNPDKGAESIFSAQNRRFDKGPVLTTNSGFGGINAALVLGESHE